MNGNKKITVGKNIDTKMEMCAKFLYDNPEVGFETEKAFRSEATVEFTRSSPCLYNDSNLSDIVYECLKNVFGKENVTLSNEIKTSDMKGGSEDFTYISERVPSITISVSAGDRADGYEYPLHNPRVRFDNAALRVGALAYSSVAIEFLTKNNRI